MVAEVLHNNYESNGRANLFDSEVLPTLFPKKHLATHVEDLSHGEKDDTKNL